jgi:putative tricarboxylic transport membrane protein
MNENSWVARLDRHGPALVAIAIGIASLAYLGDAMSRSVRLHNLILLVPLVGFVFVMAIGIAVHHFWTKQDGRPVADEEDVPTDAVSVPPAAVAAMMGSLLVYACVAPYIGFDVASALFIALCLYLQGERRWWFIVGYSILFAAAITAALAYFAGAAVPTLIV